jgi:hypothetical protein
VPLHMATVLTFPERVTEYSLAKLKQRVAAGALVLVEQRSLVFGRWPPGGGGGLGLSVLGCGRWGVACCPTFPGFRPGAPRGGGGCRVCL